MGSQISDSPVTYAGPLPDADAPSLVLAQPTEAEKRQTWTLNHAEWGGALSLEKYLEREPYLTTIPLAADGGMTHWILTTPAGEGEERPVLASCESIRKRVLYALPPRDGKGEAEVREGPGYGVCSVYTYPAYRGRQYASRMLRELGPALRSWPAKQRQHPSPTPKSNGTQQPEKEEEEEEEEQAVCSALWSDIGKQFYARKGWAAFPSVHVEFPACASSSGAAAAETNGDKGQLVDVKPITYADLPALCAADEAQLRAQVARTARETNRPAFAFAPDHAQLRWHLYRDDFICASVFPARGASEAKGVVASVPSSSSPSSSSTSTSPERRVWALWTRNYGGADPAAHPERNTLYIQRLAFEGFDLSAYPATSTSTPSEGKKDGPPAPTPDPALQAAFTAVVRAARREAAAWSCGKADLWNPGAAARALVAGAGIPGARYVDRDTDSIPSLMWYGPAGSDATASEDVEWVASEKYCWC
ncbi:hypothetical protein F4780DRAFT_578125 [Xylariomycetidae sp. FL0641]|nr:hypothetical protein F4780DRAFT_578125 [Xylariomycetidae sp. FL0641]